MKIKKFKTYEEMVEARDLLEALKITYISNCNHEYGDYSLEIKEAQDES